MSPQWRAPSCIIKCALWSVRSFTSAKANGALAILRRAPRRAARARAAEPPRFRGILWRIDVEEWIARRVRPCGDGQRISRGPLVNRPHLLGGDRSAQLFPQPDRPKRDGRMAAPGRLGASQRRLTLASRRMQARYQIARQERTVPRYADEPRYPRRILSRPIEAGQNSGERTGITRHAVGDDCQSVGGRRRIGITVKNDIVALRPKAIEHAIEDG